MQLHGLAKQRRFIQRTPNAAGAAFSVIGPVILL